MPRIKILNRFRFVCFDMIQIQIKCMTKKWQKVIKIPKRKRIEHVVKKDATLMEYFNDFFLTKKDVKD